METSNPQIEASLDALATICCDATGGGNQHAELERVDGLLKTLLMSGYARMNRSLEADLQARLKENFTETVSHRARDVSLLCEKFAKQFSDLARQQSKTPDVNAQPKAIDIATDV